MGLLVAFLVGWIMGSRGGKQGFDEVVTAGKEVLASDEFATLKVAVRQHAGYTLGQIGDWLADTDKAPPTIEDVVDRARRLVGMGPRLDD